MKKILSVIGFVLSILALLSVMVAPISRWWALIPVAALIVCVMLLCANAPEGEDDEEGRPRVRRSINWPLVIAWTLTALAFAATVLVAILAGWFCLIPLAILFGLLVWVAYLHSWGSGWCWVFIIAAILTVLVGVIFWGFVTLGGGANIDGDIDTLNVNQLNVQGATIDDATIGNAHITDSKVENQEVENATVNNQVVENQQVENQEVENATVSNQVVENQQVENQVVENQTVENQIVQKPTEPTPTEPKPTEPTPTEPKPTEPTPTEPKPTEPVHKHSYKSVVTAPTCMEQGYTTHTCDCGHSYKDAYKGALGHSYKETVVAPTTDAKGYTLHKCERCGHSYKDAYTDKLHKHSYKDTVTAATCTAQGYTTHTCACGDSYKDAYKEALGHSYKLDVVEPTRGSIGYTKHECSRCGYSYKDEFTGVISYGETLYVNLEGMSTANLLVSNKMFVKLEVLSASRFAISLTEDVDGYITVTDPVNGIKIVIDIVS